MYTEAPGHIPRAYKYQPRRPIDANAQDVPAGPMMRSQTPGTCAGMRPGQLTSLNGFIPFQGTGSLWNTDFSYAPLDPNSTKILKLLGGPAS